MRIAMFEDWTEKNKRKKVILEAIAKATPGALLSLKAGDKYTARAIIELQREKPHLFQIMNWKDGTVTIAPHGELTTSIADSTEREYLTANGHLPSPEVLAVAGDHIPLIDEELHRRRIAAETAAETAAENADRRAVADAPRIIVVGK